MITDLTARLTRKSRSNFYYAFLTLPRPRREALYAVYAFCRTVDDIADLGGERGAAPSAQRRELQRWREDVARCYEPGAVPDHPIALRLQTAVRAYTIPRAALEAIIDGVEMDLDLLDEIEARRFRVFGERVTVPIAKKLAIALRCWVAARLGRAPQRIAA